jgi:DNA-directed RNA polymerase subunit RPC12/RpoP
MLECTLVTNRTSVTHVRNYLLLSHFVRHLKIHTDDKPYLCDTCGKTFIEKSDLVNHVRVHTGDKPYKCYTCRKSFTTKCNLAKHMKIHTDDKPFSCDTCAKTFIEKRHLVNHVRVHTGDKPYECDTCSKLFAVKQSLTRHMKVHIEDKPVWFLYNTVLDLETINKMYVLGLIVSPFACSTWVRFGCEFVLDFPPYREVGRCMSRSIYIYIYILGLATVNRLTSRTPG